MKKLLLILLLFSCKVQAQNMIGWSYNEIKTSLIKDSKSFETKFTTNNTMYLETLGKTWLAAWYFNDDMYCYVYLVIVINIDAGSFMSHLDEKYIYKGEGVWKDLETDCIIRAKKEKNFTTFEWRSN